MSGREHVANVTPSLAAALAAAACSLATLAASCICSIDGVAASAASFAAAAAAFALSIMDNERSRVSSLGTALMSSSPVLCTISSACNAYVKPHNKKNYSSACTDICDTNDGL